MQHWHSWSSKLVTAHIPVFPLANVLFPDGVLALNIFEPRYLEMTRRCLEEGLEFGVFLIEGGYEVGTPAVPHRLGSMARIVEWSQPKPQNYRLRVRGTGRVRLLNRSVQDDGLIIGEVQRLEPCPERPDPLPLPDRHRPLADLLRQLIDRLGDTSPLPVPARLDDCSWVAYRWAELLRVTPETRQRWLAIDDPLALLDAVARVHRDASR